jgi:hypothetical protein
MFPTTSSGRHNKHTGIAHRARRGLTSQIIAAASTANHAAQNRGQGSNANGLMTAAKAGEYK